MPRGVQKDPTPPAVPEEMSAAASPPVGGSVSIGADAAAAVLRAACWPLYGEAHGYAESLNGDAATLDGSDPDGSLRVKLCTRQGQWYVLKVPPLVVFELAE